MPSGVEHFQAQDDPGLVGRDAGSPRLDAPLAPFDLVVADATLPWTERLFAPIADLGLRVLLIKACDWQNAWRQHRPPRDWLCPLRRRSERLWEQTFVLPPGWMKTFPRIGMRPISWAIRDWRRRLENPRPLALAISYPFYLALRNQLRPEVLLYYNIDDYGLYWLSRRESVQRLERQTVSEADLSIFVARRRSEELRAAVPGAADRIIHLPLGAPASALAPRPQDDPAPAPADIARLPRPLLGYVGSLEDRIDWPLLEHLAAEFRGGSLILIGREPTPRPDQPWYRSYQRAIALPNVHRIGWRTQDEIGQYNAAFDVCLIPYRTEHPFNRVCCPTKIMDYMATSRPIVSTDLPECRLYDHLFAVVESPAAFIEAVRAIVAGGSNDGRARLRWEAAQAATWERTSAVMLRHLETLVPA